MTDLEYLLLVVGRKGSLWARKVQAEAPGHTDACDLPLTFSQTSAGAEELTEGFGTSKQHPWNSPDLPGVAH